ncbi:MAG: hypothetical protein ABH830_00360 [Patescibacteria group bacterium]
MFKIPILFIAFNRLDTTLRVFQAIAQQKPERLFFAVDAPRNILGEKEKCDKVRSLMQKVDWPCQIKTFFPKENMGPRLAVSSAISWFFDNVEEGIILEHDCLPDHSFFKYCQELLEKYRNNDNVMHIGGYNYLPKNWKIKTSYYFCHVPQIWGWATWRRAWQHYDLQMTAFSEFVAKNKIKEIFKQKLVQDFWLEVLQKNYEGRDISWDWPWSFALFNKDGLAINPNVNLVKNIGFGKEALHTKNVKDPAARLTLESISFPLVHPTELKADRKADQLINKARGVSYLNYGVKRLLKKLGMFNIIKFIYLKLR